MLWYMELKNVLLIQSDRLVSKKILTLCHRSSVDWVLLLTLGPLWTAIDLENSKYNRQDQGLFLSNSVVLFTSTKS